MIATAIVAFRRRGWTRRSVQMAMTLNGARTPRAMRKNRRALYFRAMAHFDIPLDLPHAGRIADRLLIIVQRHAEEKEIDAPQAVDAADRLWNLLFRYSGEDDNPPDSEAMTVRDEAAAIGRELVDAVVAAKLTSDRLGQLVRNLFECLELGKEGSEISVLAGENPNSLQRPY